MYIYIYISLFPRLLCSWRCGAPTTSWRGAHPKAPTGVGSWELKGGYLIEAAQIPFIIQLLVMLVLVLMPIRCLSSEVLDQDAISPAGIDLTSHVVMIFLPNMHLRHTWTKPQSKWKFHETSISNFLHPYILDRAQSMLDYRALQTLYVVRKYVGKVCPRISLSAFFLICGQPFGAPLGPLWGPFSS